MRHAVIVVGGLGDTGNSLLKTMFWRQQYGFDLSAFDTRWRSVETFEQKMARFDKLVNLLRKKYKRISLLGTSAGGSFVFNYLIRYPSKISKAVNVCGRVKVGKLTGYRKLAAMAKTSKSFEESVRNVDCKINKKYLSRLMNIRPYWDEFVPKDTVFIKGAVNYDIFSVEHMISIFLSITVFSGIIIKFLKESTL